LGPCYEQEPDLQQYLLPSGVNQMLKSAASRLFSPDTLRDLTPPDGWWGFHNIALGSQERWGPNRNGDGFPRHTLVDRHQTFEKHGHVYRNHQHQDPKHRIGIIKAAAWNEPMDLVELICWVKRAGSEEEYEQARKGKQHTHSMSANMGYDECSCCLKKSASLKEYCEHLRRPNMLKYRPEFRKYAFAINQDPGLVFFDNSIVPKPADRNAHTLRYLWSAGEDPMLKAAAVAYAEQDDPFRTDQEAEAYHSTGPYGTQDLVPLVSLMTGPEIETLRKCAQVENEIDHAIRTSSPHPFRIGIGQHASLATELDDRDTLETLARARPGTVWRKMARAGVVLPPVSFFSYMMQRPVRDVQQDPMVKLACSHMPSLFRMMLEQLGDLSLPASLCDATSAGTELDEQMDPHADEIDQIMRRADQMFGVSPESCRDRANIVIIKAGACREVRTGTGPVEVSLEADQQAKSLAGLYGLYKLACVRDIANSMKLPEPYCAEMVTGLNFTQP